MLTFIHINLERYKLQLKFGGFGKIWFKCRSFIEMYGNVSNHGAELIPILYRNRTRPVQNADRTRPVQYTDTGKRPGWNSTQLRLGWYSIQIGQGR